MDARAFAADVMRRYRVRPEEAERILAHCDVTIIDPDSVQGGGMVQYTTRPDYWHVVLYSAQHEACLHEMAHVHYFLRQTDAMVAMLIDQYFIQASLRHRPRFKRVRQACWEAVYGGPSGKGWAWADYAGRYDDRELYAGMASLVMGDMWQLPYGLRVILETTFLPREVHTTRLPIVFG